MRTHSATTRGEYMILVIGLPVLAYFLVVAPIMNRLERAAVVATPPAAAASNPHKHSGVVNYDQPVNISEKP